MSFAQGIKSYQNTNQFRLSHGRLNKKSQNTVFEDWMNSKVGIEIEKKKMSNPKTGNTSLKKATLE